MNVHKYEVTKNKPHYRDQVFTFQKKKLNYFQTPETFSEPKQKKNNLTFFQKPTPEKTKNL